MSELLQRVLTDQAARTGLDLEIAAAQSASQFSPWATLSEE